MSKQEKIEHLVNHSELVKTVSDTLKVNNKICGEVIDTYLQTVFKKMLEAKHNTKITLRNIGSIKVIGVPEKLSSKFDVKTREVSKAVIKAHPRYSLFITQRYNRKVNEIWRYNNGIV